MAPQYVQWTIPSLLYQNRRTNPFVHKGLRVIQSELNSFSKN